MKLTILERITLAQILPAESSYITLKIIDQLRQDLWFSEKELKEYNIKETPGVDGREGQITWDNKAQLAVTDIEIGAKAREVICEALKQLDEAGKINAQNSILYEKFMTS